MTENEPLYVFGDASIESHDAKGYFYYCAPASEWFEALRGPTVIRPGEPLYVGEIGTLNG